MLSKSESFTAFIALMRHITLDNRQRYIDLINKVVEYHGELPSDHSYFTKNVSQWPETIDRSNSLIYQVDFQYGEEPDHKIYIASEPELQLLLRYTPNSLRVALSLGKGKINRTQRSTSLGPCMVHRLSTLIDLEKHPMAMRLGDREELIRKTQGVDRFRRLKPDQVRPLTYKRRSD